MSRSGTPDVALAARNRRVLILLVAFGAGIAAFTVAYVTWFHR